MFPPLVLSVPRLQKGLQIVADRQMLFRKDLLSLWLHLFVT